MRRSASLGAVLLALGLVGAAASVPAAATVTTRTTAWATTSPQPAGKVRETVPTTALIGGKARVRVDFQSTYRGSASVRVFVSNPTDHWGSRLNLTLNPVAKASIAYRVSGVVKWAPMTCATGSDGESMGKWCRATIPVPRGSSSATVVTWLSSNSKLRTYRNSYVLSEGCLPNGHVGRCADATTSALGVVLS